MTRTKKFIQKRRFRSFGNFPGVGCHFLSKDMLFSGNGKFEKYFLAEYSIAKLKTWQFRSWHKNWARKLRFVKNANISDIFMYLISINFNKHCWPFPSFKFVNFYESANISERLKFDLDSKFHLWFVWSRIDWYASSRMKIFCFVRAFWNNDACRVQADRNYSLQKHRIALTLR